MKAKEVKDLWIKIWADMNVGVEPIEEEELKALTKFAEISFKAGYEECGEKLEQFLLKWKQAGRREVVEWLRQHPRIIDDLRDVLPRQLKEWGIDD